jgi:hypothetical protein
VKSQSPDADSQTNQWAARKTVMSYGRGYSDRRRANDETGETLFTSSTAEAGIYFSCLDKKFRVGLVYEAQSMSDAFSSLEISGISGNGNFVPTQSSLAFVSVRLDGQKKNTLGQWLYFEDNAATLSRDNEGARILYNAVVRGQNIALKIRDHDPVTLVVPSVSDVFAEFGADCGVGRNRNR